MNIKIMAQSLRRCRQIQSIKYGRSLHSQLLKSGLLKHVFLSNNMICVYANSASLQEAHQLFDEITDKNVISWTSLISAYTHAGQPSEALRVFSRMLEVELEIPNSFTYSTALKACALLKNIEVGKLIHQSVLRSQLQCDTILMNAVLDMYVKCGSLDDARRVFNDMSQPNLTSWNSIIDGYCKEGQMEEALNLFHRMPEPDVVSWNTIIAGHTCKQSPEALHFVSMMHGEGLKLNDFTFPCALKVCGGLGFLRMGEQIHCYVVKSGSKSGCYIGSALVDMYAKCGRVNESIMLFNEGSSGEQHTVYNTVALWNSMISGYAFNQQNASAIDLVSQLHSTGVALDCYTFSSALKVCIVLLNLRLGIQVHGLTITYGYQLDSIVGSILVDMYAKCGEIRHALGLFRILPEKDVVAWAGLIAGCAQQGSNSLAFALFREMVCLNLRVDQFVVSSLLKACSSKAGLLGGKLVHAYCHKSGFESEGVTITSLIDMYSKCGEIEDSLMVFKSAKERDAVCWTGIIVGCGQNGRANDAIGLFQDMLKSGMKPNEITFLGVLSACRYAGLVEKACTIFDSMAADHGLVPSLEHYCCMVDLLGRAGCFEAIERLIADMPYKPNKTIWGSLLAACGIHKNIELGKRVAERLRAIMPQDLSMFVTLSNIHASLGMWDDLIKLREIMRGVGMKEAGRSWIEVCN